MKKIDEVMREVKRFLNGDATEKEAINAVLGGILDLTRKISVREEQLRGDDCEDCGDCDEDCGNVHQVASPNTLKLAAKTLSSVSQRLFSSDDDMLKDAGVVVRQLAEVCCLNADIEITLCSGGLRLSQEVFLGVRDNAVNRVIPNIREQFKPVISSIKSGIVESLCSGNTKKAKVLASVVNVFEIYMEEKPFGLFMQEVERLEKRTS